MTGEAHPVDLVFEGGGVKGIGLAGAFWELERQGHSARLVAGTSAGAITAALVAVGYNGEELKTLVLEGMHFPEFADGGGGLVGEGLRLLHRKGLHKGDYFRDWMREKLEAKGRTRFGDLRTDEPPANGRAPYRLKVIASDLALSRLLILPDDAALLGIEPDELEVADAVRMSMSIPIFFAPVVRENPKTGNEHLIVDGGLLSNFPVWLFDLPAGQQPRCPTFGLLLVAPNASAPLAVGPPEDTGTHRDLNMIEFLEAIAHTAMEAHDRLYLEQATFARTIPISTIGVSTTDFGIQPDRAKALFQSGVDAAATFLQTWDLDAYNAAFRSGRPQPTRRERVVAHMRRQAGEPPSDEPRA